MKTTVLLFLIFFGNTCFSQVSYSQLLADFYLKYDNGDYEKALIIAQKGTQLFPDSIAFWGRRGEMHAHFNNHNQAIKDYNKAFDLGETIPELYLLRAVSYQNLDSLDKAAADYAYLEELGMFKETVHPFYGGLEFERGNYDHSKNLLRPLFGTSFDFPRKEYALIHSFYLENELDSTIFYATKLIELDSTQIRAHGVRAECYRRLDMRFEACEDFLFVFAAGDYKYKQYFDSYDCFQILKMSDPESPYSYPPPPPPMTSPSKKEE